TGRRLAAPTLRDVVADGTRIRMSAITLFEWLRGPRQTEELQHQENVLPSSSVLVFGPAEAARAAVIYRQVSGARGREADIAIAATAIIDNAPLWTLNPDDFDDIPDLRLFTPPRP